MYRKKSKGWYKHKDFIFIDLLCVALAFMLADIFRNGHFRNIYENPVYRNAAIFLLILDLCICITFESYKGVLRRGYYQEFRAVVKQTALLELGAALYLFSVDSDRSFSRMVLYLTGTFYFVFTYVMRILWRKRLKDKMMEGGEHSLYIITTRDIAENVISNVRENNYNRYNINGLVIIDRDMTGKVISGIPVVSDLENAATYICQQWVDEVLINIGGNYGYPQKLMDELLEMGMVVHLNLARAKNVPGRKRFVETVAVIPS